MHGMFVQMIVVLFPVTLADFIIVPDNIVHLIPDILIIPQRIMSQIGIHKQLRFKLGIHSRIRINMNGTVFKPLITPSEIIHGIFHRIENMLFLFPLRIRVPCQRILQPPELCVGIPAKGLDGSFGQKQTGIFQKFPAQVMQIQIVLWVQPQKLQCIGIAV